jgi:N-6 DNA Methylase
MDKGPEEYVDFRAGVGESVRMMVDVLAPQPGELILDPACGSGGFLIVALEYVWRGIEEAAERKRWSKERIAEERRYVASQFFKGIEKDRFLAKVTKAYMAILGDGRSGVQCENSLLPPASWDPVMARDIKLGAFDVVITNPPFGTKIPVKGREVLDQFDLGHKFQRSKDDRSVFERSKLVVESQPPQLLEELAGETQLICLADADQVIFDWTDPTIARRIADYRASGATVYDLGYDSRRDPSNVIPRAAAAIRERDYGSDVIAEACRDDRLRIVQNSASEDGFDALVDLIREAQGAGASQLGVFLATNRSVNDFAERLRSEEMEHEIIGLSGAAGESQLAIAACARFVVGDGEWDEFLIALGVFVASCYRGTPPELAFGLVRDRELLEPGLMTLLEAERDAFRALAGEPLEAFLGRAESFWRRLFRGRPRQLWELGTRDFRGQTLGLRGRPVDRTIAAAVTQLAQARRSVAWVDEITWPKAPISLMNVYQVKGREMDEVLLVHFSDDSDQWDPDGMSRLRRVHYVSMSRARRRVTLLLPPHPKPFFAPYASLCMAAWAG